MGEWKGGWLNTLLPLFTKTEDESFFDSVINTFDVVLMSVN